MQVLKPPARSPVTRPTAFLAGTIDMGSGPDWQADVERALAPVEGTIFNPRRDEWDSSWEQTIHHPRFREQVEWELDHLLGADLALFYFAEHSQSPITLLELGLVAASLPPERVVVGCGRSFWRRGNVEVVCHRYGLELVDDLPSLIARARAVLG